MRQNSSELKAFARELGFELCGVCAPQAPPHFDAYQKWIAKGSHGGMGYLADHISLKENPKSLLPECQSIIVVALNYNQPSFPIEGHPKIARYALGRDYHKVIKSKLNRLAQWIELAHPEAKHRACVDTAPIMERDFANLAGLGWFGKNTCLINSERGSWFFIGVLLTSVPYEEDAPAIGGCGTCRACIDACPTGAIVFEDDHWQVDARRCISYLTIENEGSIEPDLATRMQGWTVGCDVCQEVCPFNMPRSSQPLRARFSNESEFAHRLFPDLEELVDLSENTWDLMTRGSATRRLSLEQWRRNARINLENKERGSS